MVSGTRFAENDRSSPHRSGSHDSRSTLSSCYIANLDCIDDICNNVQASRFDIDGNNAKSATRRYRHENFSKTERSCSRWFSCAKYSRNTETEGKFYHFDIASITSGGGEGETVRQVSCQVQSDLVAGGR